MLILIEGVDKAGKSTLAAQLSTMTGWPVFRKPVPETLASADFPAYFMGVGFALASLHPHFASPLLVDRSFASDWVYSDGATLGWPRWQQWEAAIMSGGLAVLVYVHCRPRTVRQRLLADPDPYLSPAHIHLHLHRYDDYLRRSTLPIIRCSGERSVDHTARSVLAYIENVRRNTKP